MQKNGAIMLVRSRLAEHRSTVQSSRSNHHRCRALRKLYCSHDGCKTGSGGLNVSPRLSNRHTSGSTSISCLSGIDPGRSRMLSRFGNDHLQRGHAQAYHHEARHFHDPLCLRLKAAASGWIIYRLIFVGWCILLVTAPKGPKVK